MNWDLVKQQVGYDAQAKIKEILDSEYFMNSLYVDANGKELDKAKRDELGQFYTPGDICIKMINKFTWDTLAGKTILDPTVGSGNLLIACLIAGADIDKLYGNEYDAEVIPTCRNRIREAFREIHKRYPTKEEFEDWQIHQGNALIADCLTEFGPDYDNTILVELLKPRRKPKGNWLSHPEHYIEYKAKCKTTDKEVVDMEVRSKEANLEAKQTINNNYDSYGFYGGTDNE